MEIRAVSPSPPLWKCQAPWQWSLSKVLLFLLSLTFYLWCQEDSKSWHFYFPFTFFSSHCLLSPHAFYLIILTSWGWAGESIFFHKEIPLIHCGFLGFLSSLPIHTMNYSWAGPCYKFIFYPAPSSTSPW